MHYLLLLNEIPRRTELVEGFESLHCLVVTALAAGVLVKRVEGVLEALFERVGRQDVAAAGG